MKGLEITERLLISLRRKIYFCLLTYDVLKGNIVFPKVCIQCKLIVCFISSIYKSNMV